MHWSEQNTVAKSLQYECIHTLTLALPYTKRADGSESKNVPAVVRLCCDHLRQFIEDPDQNLKCVRCSWGFVGRPAVCVGCRVCRAPCA